MMLTCDICGKKIFTAWPDNWPYRHGKKIFCSDNCKTVHAARDLHKIEYIRLDEGPLTGLTPFVFGKNKEKEERKDDMRGKPIMEEDNQKAIDMALAGEDPIAFLKECGAKNPYGNWGYIKMKLQKKDPEKYQQLMEAERKRKEMPMAAVVEKAKKLPEDAQTKKPEPAFVPDPMKTMANKKADLEYKVIGIETKLGKFQYDKASNQMRWMPNGSMVVVMMPAEDWEKMAADLPKIMKAIGADCREDDEE